MPSASARKSSTPSRRASSAEGHNTAVGDEGGFAPNLKSAEEALGFIMKSIEKAGYRPGEDVFLGLDCAATEYYKGGKYAMDGEGKSLSSEENVKFLADLAARFPIIRSKTAWPKTIGKAGKP